MRKNGECYAERLHVRAIHDDGGSRTNYIGVFTDVSKQHEMEEELRQAQKMAAVGTLVGGVAHNFNNMLAGIMGYAYVAKSRCQHMKQDSINISSEIEGIEQIAMRAGDMLHQLLAFARKGVKRRREVQLNQLLNDALEETKLDLPQDVACTFNCCPQTLIANIDDHQFHQILVNLINNARDAVAGRESKQISICLQYQSADTLNDSFFRHHPNIVAEQLALFQIKDNGEGMTKEKIDQIFDPFFTTKNIGSGTGLGLSMALGVAEDHGGAIEVESQAGEGSTFSLWIPITSSKNKHQQEYKMTPLQENIINTEGLLLLIDDDDLVRDTISQMLEVMGYQVVTASNGEEALQVFTLHQDEINIVISDVVMSGLNGPDAVAEMRTLKPLLPTVFITGYDKNVVCLDAKYEDITKVLTKPFHIEKVTQVIQQLISKRDAINV